MNRLARTGLGAALVCLSMLGIDGAAALADQVAAPHPAAPTMEPPHRRPGLWRQTTLVDGGPNQVPTMDICVDDATETRLSIFRPQTDQSDCRMEDMHRNFGGSISFSSTCDRAGLGKRTIKGRATGDYANSYKVVLDVTTTGAASNTAGGARRLTMTGTWLGACPAGSRGGDMVLPNGRKINLLDVGSEQASGQ